MENITSKFKSIDDFAEFKKYFDLNNLDADKTPKIITDKKCIFVFDNFDNNNAYLLELVENYLNKSTEYSDAELFYINLPKVRLQLFNPDLDLSKFDFELDYYNIEKEYLVPTILLINPEDNHIVVFTETIVIFNDEMLNNIFTWLK